MKPLANFISILFHPLLLMTYIVLLLSFINPYIFGVNDAQGNMRLVVLVFMYTGFLPFFAILMMKALGFISSFEMRGRKERIGPLISTIIFYMWLSFQCYKLPEVPTALTIFIVGGTIGLSLAFVINVFSKINLYTLGMGALLGMVIITMLKFSYGSFFVYDIEVDMSTLLINVILACGLVGTSRLLLNAGERTDIYGGFFVGFVTQFVGLALLS